LTNRQTVMLCANKLYQNVLNLVGRQAVKTIKIRFYR